MHHEPHRERFHRSSDSPAQAAHARLVLRLLLNQDGSTTRLCEALAQGPVSVRLFDQEVVGGLPAPLGPVLPGARFLRRLTALEAHGQVLMDNISYIALEGLPRDILQELEQGTTPIGHLLARLWVRRQFRSEDTALLEQLWSRVGLPDPAASRSYTIVTPDGPCMLIGETFRRGMLELEASRPARP